MNNLLQIGIVLTAIDRMSGVLGGATDKAGQGFSRLQQRIHQCSQAMTEMGTKATVMGQGLIKALETPVKAFTDFESAMTNAQLGFMKTGGRVPEVFEKVSELATQLSVKLPGADADFQRLIGTMGKLDISGQSMLEGTLEAAAYLGAVLQVPYEDAGKYIAKFGQALGIASKDQVAFADTIQRTFFLGVKTEEMSYGFSKLAGTIKGFSLQGIDAANAYTPLLAMLVRTGRSGEEAGTGLGNVLNTLVDMKKVGEANSILKQFGIHLDFVNKKTGQLNKDPMAILGQLQKLSALNDVTKKAVIKELFGSGGAAEIAEIFAFEGQAGYQKIVESMQSQADLKTRAMAQLGTLGGAWDAATGTWTSTLAKFAGTAKGDLVAISNAICDVSDALGKWVKANPELSRGIFLAAAGAAALLVTAGGLGIVLGALGQGAMFALGGLRVLSGVFMFLVNTIGTLGRIVAWIGPIIGRTLLTAFLAAAKGAWAFTAALLANPITWIIAGIIALGVAIYMLVKHWDVVKASAQQFWGWLTSWAGRVGTVIGQAVSRGWEATKSASAQALSAMSEVGTKIVAAFQAIPSKLFDAGAAMLDMLIAGIKSKIGAVVNTVSGLTERIRGFFNRSPAKEGALRDIHQHPFSEMVAQAIRPEPVVRSVRTMTSAAVVAMAPLNKTSVAAKASSLMGDSPWQAPRLQAILRKHGGMAAAAGSSASSTPKGLGRRVPISGAPATPSSVARAQAVAGFAHPAVAAKAASLMHDPKWQAPRLQAILRKHGGATAAAKPLPATPAPASRPQARPGGGSGGQGGAARGAGGRAGGGSVTVTYNVNAQGSADKGAIMAALKQHEHELVRLIEQVMARNGRRQY